MLPVRKAYFGALRLVAASAISLSMIPAIAQVSPSEILNPRLQALQEKYLPQLQSLHQSIAACKLPSPFRLARYVKAIQGQKAALDSNGIEFVYFQQHVVLKVSGVYTAALSPARLTENQRANRTFQDAIVPILRLVARQIPEGTDFDAVGFEILYETRDATRIYDFEGKEVLTVVFGRDDLSRYANATALSERQQLLNRSEIFVNGKELGLALGQRDPLIVGALERSVPRQAKDESSLPTEVDRADVVSGARVLPAVSVTSSTPASTSPPTFADVMRLQSEFQEQLNRLVKEKGTGLHLEEGTAPSFEVNGDHALLHLTMRNTLSFEKDTTSIYRRAAQSFDLFLAPELRDLAKNLSVNGDYDALEFSVLNHLRADKTPFETIDYICPLNSMRSFVANRITSQDLINQSIILVNGVRIGLNLQLVE
jgi:hypothetical protein